MQCEREEAARDKLEVIYKKNIQEYRDKKQQINKLLTLLASKEVDKWSVADQKKLSTGRISRLMVRRLQVIRTCLPCGTWCGGGPNPPGQICPRRRWIWMEESTLRSTAICVKVTISINSRQFLSKHFVSIMLIFCELSNICLCRFYIN